MNELGCVFAKEGSLVEVPYVEPSFLGSLDVKSMIPRSYEYERIICKMLCVICNMLCAMCKMLCAVCNMISMMMHVTLME